MCSWSKARRCQHRPLLTSEVAWGPKTSVWGALAQPSISGTTLGFLEYITTSSHHTLYGPCLPLVSQFSVFSRKFMKVCMISHDCQERCEAELGCSFHCSCLASSAPQWLLNKCIGKKRQAEQRSKLFIETPLCSTLLLISKCSDNIINIWKNCILQKWLAFLTHSPTCYHLSYDFTKICTKFLLTSCSINMLKWMNRE